MTPWKLTFVTHVCKKKGLVSYAVTTKCVSISKPQDNKKAVNKTKTNTWSSSRPITNEYVKPITNEYVKPVTNDITKLASLCLASKFGSHGNQINPKASNAELNVHKTSLSCMCKLVCLCCHYKTWGVCVCMCFCVHFASITSKSKTCWLGLCRQLSSLSSISSAFVYMCRCNRWTEFET